MTIAVQGSHGHQAARQRDGDTNWSLPAGPQKHPPDQVTIHQRTARSSGRSAWVLCTVSNDIACPDKDASHRRSIASAGGGVADPRTPAFDGESTGPAA